LSVTLDRGPSPVRTSVRDQRDGDASVDEGASEAGDHLLRPTSSEVNYGENDLRW
jgi:hypothetical protein